jgi:hypothetical protein
LITQYIKPSGDDTETPDFPGIEPLSSAEADLRFVCTLLDEMREIMPKITLADLFSGSEIFPAIVAQYTSLETKGGAN